MGKTKTDQELEEHKKQSLKALDDLHKHFLSTNNHKKSGLISYWIKDYVNFLRMEESFKPSRLKKYKRGEIIKVSLGYRIGSEQGGLHYAVVLDKNNSIHSPVLTIIPLSSIKPKTNLSNLPKDKINLGIDIYSQIINKLSAHQTATDIKLKSAREYLDNLCVKINSLDEKITNASSEEEIVQIKKDNKQILDQIACESILATENVEKLEEMVEISKKLEVEITKMKSGSIALVNQITTVSKIRIFDPKKNNDILSNIKLSAEGLNLIDQSIKECYTNY